MHATMTARQTEIYEFIRSRIWGRGYGPTVREIGRAFDIKSPNGVMCHLKALAQKGVIVREPDKSRAISLVDDPSEADRLRADRGRLLAACRAAHALIEARGDPRSGWQCEADDLLCTAIEGAES